MKIRLFFFLICAVSVRPLFSENIKNLSPGGTVHFLLDED